jgi:Tfp pilus assembly protein PilX
MNTLRKTLVSRLREENGGTVVAAMLTGVIALGLGTAVLQQADSQSRQTGAERAREAAFQVAESALNNGAMQVARTFPTSSAAAFSTCTQSTSPSARCIGTALNTNFTSNDGGTPTGGVDFPSSPTWSVRVLDDLDGPSYYDESLLTRGAAGYDAAGGTGGAANGYVWVRSTSSVGGHSYTLVTLVGQGAPRQEILPRNAITAGWFRTTNNGKKVIVNVKGSSAVAGSVAVRCHPANAGPRSGDPCLGYDPNKGQLSPAGSYKFDYVDGSAAPNATNRRSLDADALARLKARAISLGTYYATGCPPSLTGSLIYVENANCSYSTGTANSAASPGVLVFASGTLSLSGNYVYNGVVYMANGQGSAPASGPCTSSYQNTVISLTGTSLINGAVFIDKCGGMLAGSSGLNFTFDSNALDKVVSNGAATTVKNGFKVVASS